MSYTVKYRIPATMATRARGMAHVAPEGIESRNSPTRPEVSRLARQLALAYKIERLVEAGELRDYADAARTLGMTRARLTQIVNLRWLTPRIQEAIIEGKISASERDLRSTACNPVWERQIEAPRPFSPVVSC